MVGPKGISFNGYDLSPYLKANPTRPILPPMEVTTDEVPGAMGRRFHDVNLGELEIPVKVRLRARAHEDMPMFRRMLAQALFTVEPAPLVLGDDPTRYYMAILSGSTELSSLIHTGSATLTFLCPDPIAHGATRRCSVSGTESIITGGNWPARPLITAKPGICSSFTIRVPTSGRHITVNRPFYASDALVIDCKDRRCYINGSPTDAHVTLDSDYFQLLGKEIITLSSGTATLEWTERWL